MKKILYAVKDELSNEFLNPALMLNDDVAKRQFKTQVNTIDLWRENSSDYSLYRIGTFDDVTGLITSELEKLTGGRSVLNA